MIPGGKLGMKIVGSGFRATRNKSGVKNAFDHWYKHKGEFPEFQNSLQYVKGTRNFIDNSPVGTLTKTRKNGDTLLYNIKTNTFAAKDINGNTKTMFRPKGGLEYWKNQ